MNSTTTRKRGGAGRQTAKKNNNPNKDIKRKTKRPDFIKKVSLASSNPYLASLLDPEGVQGVRLPDGYCQRTAMVPGIVNKQIPYFPSTSNIEPAGSFNLVVRPSLVHPVWTYGKQKSAITSYDGFVDEQGTYGLFPLDPSEPGISQQIGAMILPPGLTCNVKYPMTFPQVDWQQDPYRATDANGDEFYGQPLSGYSVLPTMNCRVKINGQGVAGGDTLKFDLVDSRGNSSTATSVYVADSNQFIISGLVLTSFFLNDADAEIAKATPRPGIGLRLTSTLASNHSVSIESIHVYVNIGTPAAAKYAMYPFDLESQGNLLGIVDSFRTISQSALLTYMGSTLTDGGQISALTYLGGEHPNELNFWNYSGISQAVNSPYNGQLRHGTYCIWKPKDTKDTQFRAPGHADAWEHPYIAIAGVVSSPDTLNMLRLRVFANYEVISKSTLLNQAYGYDSPGKIRQAMSVLRTFPLAGQNDTHVENIKRILSSVWDTGKKAVEWGWDNRGWLVPAATALAALL